MRCHKCDHEINQGDEYCGSCGSKLKNSSKTEGNICAGCKSEMPANETNCQKCGMSKKVFESEEHAETSARKSKRSRVPGIIFIVIGLAVIIFAFTNYQTTGETLRTDNNPGIGLQHVMSFPIGIVGLIVLIAGLVFLREPNDRP
jgi:hypothetical protein